MDHASRGLSAEGLFTSNWFTGPKFLWERALLPVADAITELTIGDPEVKRSQALSTQTAEQVSLSDHVSRLSLWSKAIQAVACFYCQTKKDMSNCLSTVMEHDTAECIIIRDLQRQAYPEEIKSLSKEIPLSPCSKLYHFDPFLDQDEPLKVG